MLKRRQSVMDVQLQALTVLRRAIPRTHARARPAVTRQRCSRRLGLQGKQARSAAAKWRALVRRLRDMHWSRSLVVRCALRVTRCV